MLSSWSNVLEVDRSFDVLLVRYTQEYFNSNIPPTVWVLVFDLLDDMTLWSVGRVCRRWQQLVDRYVSDDQWQKYTQRRWPLYKPLFENVPWQMVYTKL